MAEKKISYEEAFSELQNIIGKLQSNEIELDSLAKEVKRAQVLLSQCKQKLRDVEKDIEKVME